MALLSTNAFPHKCTIQRRSNVADQIGGKRIVPVVEQTNVACWEQPISSRDMAVAQLDKTSFQFVSKVYFLSDPGVTDNHEIVITSRNGISVATADQIPLQVVKPSVPDASVGLGRLFKVIGGNSPGTDT